MTTCVRFCSSYDPSKMNVLNKKNIADIFAVSDVICTRKKYYKACVHCIMILMKRCFQQRRNRTHLVTVAVVNILEVQTDIFRAVTTPAVGCSSK